MSVPLSDLASEKRDGRKSVVPWVVVVTVALWCVLVLYVVVCVSYLGVMYPLGRSAPASLFYGILLMNPMFPGRTKVDLPIMLVHAFVLYKCLQWLWRQRQHEALNRPAEN